MPVQQPRFQQLCVWQWDLVLSQGRNSARRWNETRSICHVPVSGSSVPLKIQAPSPHCSPERAFLGQILTALEETTCPVQFHDGPEMFWHMKELSGKDANMHLQDLETSSSDIAERNTCDIQWIDRSPFHVTHMCRFQHVHFH